MRFKKNYFTSHYRKQYKVNYFKKTAYNSYVKYLFNLKQGTILDCGCGIGNFLRFAEKKFVAMGFDISDYAISQAKNNTKKSKLWVSSVEKVIPLKDEYADVVTAFDIVEHFTDHDFFFKEVRRIMHPQGVFLIRTPNLNSYSLQRKGKTWYGYRDDTHISLRYKEYWFHVLTNTGFSILDYGTDLIWDTPVFSNLTKTIEKLIFKGSKMLFQYYKPFAHVDWGDNLIILCKKT